MKSQYYGFEIKDILRQFVSAFNDVVISRFNHNNREDPEHKIQVNFLYAPKERVFFDLTNKNQHITLPVIAVSLQGIERDSERVFNKLEGFYDNVDNDCIETPAYHTPIPINITVSMSILTKFQTDMDQILSNFIPHTNPYIIISWKIPNNQNLHNDMEIHSEVLWSGSISIEYPTDLNKSDPCRCSATTSFTIKGWLFKENKDPVRRSFNISQSFVPTADFDYE